MWVNPTPGRHEITARFGEAGPRWSSGKHTGLDFSAPHGSDVVAVEKGVVISAMWGGSAYGNLVKIRHAGVDSWYGHLSAMDVRPLQTVAQGRKIGEVGETGNATGAHVHLEARVAGVAVDPQKYLSGSVTGDSDGDGILAGIGAGITSAIPGLDAVLAFADGVQNVIGFVVNPENWKRVALFMGGGTLVILALYMTFQSGADKLVREVIST